MTIELPYPPSVNRYYRHVGAKVLISADGRAFRQVVVLTLISKGMTRTHGPLHVSVQLFPPDKRRRDIDNAMKALLDALQHGGAYEDDSQITKLTIEKKERCKNGKSIITIEERSNEEYK